MPRDWYDPHYVEKIEDEERRNLYNSIVAERKPYFMRYVYPSISKDFNDYKKKSSLNHLIKFGTTISESMENNEEADSEFCSKYIKDMPLGVGDCVMNKICWLFEKKFGSAESELRKPKGTFNQEMYKSGSQYSSTQVAAIKKLYKQYNSRIKSYQVNQYYEHIDEGDISLAISAIRDEFVEDCYKVCSNRYELCDIIIDIAYQSDASKGFAWAICGDVMIDNLMRNCSHALSFPKLDSDGDISYCGNTYTMATVELNEEDDNVPAI